MKAGDTSSRELPKAKDPLRACFLIFLVALPIARGLVIKVGGQAVQPSDLAAATCVGIWLVQLFRGRAQLRIDRLLIATTVFVGALLLSLASAGQLSARPLLKLSAFGVFLLLPLISPDILGDKASVDLAIRAWLLSATIAVAIGLAGIATFYLHRPIGLAMMCGYGGIPAGNYPRLCAPFRSPSMFCNYLIVSVAFLLATGNLRAGRVWTWALAIAAGVVTSFTFSAGMGGFALAAAIALIGPRLMTGGFWRLRDRALAVSAAAVAAFFALSMIATLQPAGQGNISLGGTDLLVPDGMRPSIWKGVLPAIRNHPLVGIGYGALVSETDDPRAFTSPNLIPLLPRPIKPQRLEAHNVWLNVLGQSGLIGLAAFSWLIYEVLRRLRRAAGRRGPRATSLTAALTGAIVGAFFFHGFFSAIEEARHIWALFALITAAAAVARIEQREQPVSSSGGQSETSSGSGAAGYLSIPVDRGG